MITKFTIRNFKKIKELEIELERRVALVGPNNSGKTTLLQAITVWDIGLRKWSEQKRNSKAKKRRAVTINRNDILAAPLPNALLLWKDLHVRKTSRDSEGRRDTKNIRFELIAEGVTTGKRWKIGLEFDYANTESLYCRSLQNETDEPFPEVALNEHIGFLPPMSGLAPFEDLLVPEVMYRRIGEGRTSEILRNLLYNLVNEKYENWMQLKNQIRTFFDVELSPPLLVSSSALTMSYKEFNVQDLDLSSAGRGFHQLLLILAFLYTENNSILLLDEPDAHLEVLRQKEVYKLLTKTADKTESQIIIATHSETVLDEAVQTGQVIAFIGNPHVVKKDSDLKKSLNLIGYTDYLLAERYKKIIYLEGSTDFDILKAFASILNHPILPELDDSFIKYVSNNRPQEARKHFSGLLEAVTDLKGFALFDNIPKPLNDLPSLKEFIWRKNEIENYLLFPDTLLRFVKKVEIELPLFDYSNNMTSAINNSVAPKYLKNLEDDYWRTVKMSDEILSPIFSEYYNSINQPVMMNKGDYYRLVELMKKEEVDEEVIEKLDLLYSFLES